MTACLPSTTFQKPVQQQSALTSLHKVWRINCRLPALYHFSGRLIGLASPGTERQRVWREALSRGPVESFREMFWRSSPAAIDEWSKILTTAIGIPPSRYAPKSASSHSDWTVLGVGNMASVGRSLPCCDHLGHHRDAVRAVAKGCDA